MLSTSVEATPAQSRDVNSAHFFVLRGREAILRMRDVLVDLSQRCSQTGAMDYLEYFMTSTDNLKKTPHLVLAASRADLDPFGLRAEDLLGAVLVYEYRILGLGSRVFNTSDFDGSRAVIAPARDRSRISAMVCRHLVERGAQVVMLSFAGDAAENCLECFESARASDKRRWWTTRTRDVGATILLEKSVDATLAAMGKHTRRNLRYYRRKAEEELHCTFESNVKDTLTRPQLTELNRASTHPVSDTILERRYNTTKTLEGLFCVGVKTPDGQWISLLGGRRHHGVSEIDWQINRGGLEKYSVGTVIRAYLIEHEISIGMNKLFFEGGTPHSMRLTFLSEKAVDIVVAARSPFVFLLRRLPQSLHPRNNFLLRALVDPTLSWKLH